MSAPKATITITGGNMYERKSADLRDTLALVNEAKFSSYFCVAKAIRGWSAVGTGIDKRDQEVQLHVRHDPVVDLYMG